MLLPPPQWQVELESVTSSDPAVNHQNLWFQRGELTSYEGPTHIWTIRYVNGVASRVGAGE